MRNRRHSVWGSNLVLEDEVLVWWCFVSLLVLMKRDEEGKSGHLSSHSVLVGCRVWC